MSSFKRKIFGLAVCAACTVLLPFYLLDEFHCATYQKGAGNSVFMNAVRFYSGRDETHGKDRYIAIVAYIGLPDKSDHETVRSSVDGIIRDHVTPAFERKGLHIDNNTTEITVVRLYYRRGKTGEGEPGISVFCFVSSIAAFAPVLELRFCTVFPYVNDRSYTNPNLRGKTNFRKPLPVTTFRKNGFVWFSGM